MDSWTRTLNSALLVGLLGCAPAERIAPGIDRGPVDQLQLAGNACGPAALLTAWRCGSPSWRRLADTLPGEDERDRLRFLAYGPGREPSLSLPGRPRWTRDGINAEDLTQLAAELATDQGLPSPGRRDLFRRSDEPAAAMLRRAHRELRRSLARGHPPVLGLRRHRRDDPSWPAVETHFVTVVKVGTRSGERFPITCFDPWRGRVRNGTIALPPGPLLGAPDHPCLELDLPGGLTREASTADVIVPTVMIGR